MSHLHTKVFRLRISNFYDMMLEIAAAHCFILFFFQSSGPGLLGPSNIILQVRSGSEGPQFSRSDRKLIVVDETGLCLFLSWQVQV